MNHYQMTFSHSDWTAIMIALDRFAKDIQHSERVQAPADAAYLRMMAKFIRAGMNDDNKVDGEVIS